MRGNHFCFIARGERREEQEGGSGYGFIKLRLYHALRVSEEYLCVF